MHLGIDFGTCFTSAAILLGDQFRFIQDTGGGNAQPAYPSAVYLDAEGELLLGTLAKNMARRDPSRFRQEFKRELGSDTPFYLGEQQFLPQDLIARLLHQLKSEAEQRYNTVFPAAVLTVPASYDAYRRRLMLEAGVAAGFRADGVVLLDEPEAAALAYDRQLQQQGRAIEEGAIILVYDLGGGTFDAALMRKEGERFRSLVPPVGDPHCGGIDFDRAIYQEILATGGTELEEALAAENMSVQALRKRLQIADLCREVKHQLTRLPRYEDLLPEPSVEEFMLPRATFEQKIAPHIERTIALCEELVSCAGCSWDDISGLLLVGGSSRIPYISTRLTEAFGRPLWQVEDAQMAVCMGAALHTGYRRALKSVVMEHTVRTNPVLAVGKDDTVVLWDSVTGEAIRTFPGQAGIIRSIALSPDGRLVAAGGDKGTVQCLDTSTGELRHTFKTSSEVVKSLVFNPDGTTLACTGDNGAINMWNLSAGRILCSLRGHTGPVNSLAFRPDGKMLVSGSDDNDIIFWDAFTGDRLRTARAHRSQVQAVAFSPNGRLVISGGYDSKLKWWDIATGQESRAIDAPDWIDAVAISPDGKSIAAGGRFGILTLWDSANGKKIRSFNGHTEEFDCLAFSPDGRTLASSSRDRTVKIWDAATGEALHTFPNPTRDSRYNPPIGPLAYSSDRFYSQSGHSNPVRTLAASSDGTVVASGSEDQTVKLWNPETGEALATLGDKNGAVVAVDFVGRASSLVVADASLGFWDQTTQQRTEPAFGPASHVRCVAGSPDGKLIVSASDEAFLCLWDAATHEPLHVFLGHKAIIRSVVFSPDSALVVSGSDDGTVKIWSVTERRLLATLTGHESGVCSIAISPDGKTLASGGKDSTARLWDASTWRPMHTLTGHTEEIRSVAFSADGRTLASADTTIRLWTVATGEAIQTLTGHEEAVNAVLFTSQDTRLISGSDDRSMRFWKLEWA